MRRSTFIKTRAEEDIIREAIYRSDAKEELRWAMSELSKRIAEEMCYELCEDDEDILELAEVGMTCFDRAFRHYLLRQRKNIERGMMPYTFSSYFSWWITESIRTYLGVSLHPIKGIKPKTS